MTAPTPRTDYPILLWALTTDADLSATYCSDLETAEQLGRHSVRTGEWKTWDAFELPRTGQPAGRKLVSSHGRHRKRKRIIKH
jgi:hypothetical protein